MAKKTGVGRSILPTDSVEFERQLEVFRTEAEQAAQFFYAYLAVHATAGKHPGVHKLLNTAPLFWNTSLGALQMATFITLGRIFDDTSAHSVHKLLNFAHQHNHVFSLPGLRQRKIQSAGGGKVPSWLPSYLLEAYEPTDADFRRIKAYTKKYRKLYDQKAKDIRHKLFAHKELADSQSVEALFSQTRIRDIQNIIVFLLKLHEALQQLFINGRKPILRSQSYSVARIMRGKRPPRELGSVQERVTAEARNFLNAALDVSRSFGKK